ncbi:SufE family protein [Geminicoccaceae bacterium 1502E]|nr:SufE family protein [Geminicoccaceae bacterium 1502E]
MAEDATIADTQRALKEDFELLEDPRDRIEYIIDLGKRLAPLDERHKTEGNRVRGCQSQVWMVAELDEKAGRIHLAADSDAIIVKGLIALLLRLYDGRTAEEILANPPTVLEEIGLKNFLTPGRSNGLYSMINRIRQLAGIYAGVTPEARAAAG